MLEQSEGFKTPSTSAENAGANAGRKYKHMKKFAIGCALAGAVATGIFAQSQDGPGRGFGPGGPGGPGGRRGGPLLAIFDTNKDGVIDADEIAKASDSLKKLDKNGDGKITEDELRPPRPADAPAQP